MYSERVDAEVLVVSRKTRKGIGLSKTGGMHKISESLARGLQSPLSLWERVRVRVMSE